ncbi:MAG: metallophosphoesterase [Gemmatimonadota bacterium]
MIRSRVALALLFAATVLSPLAGQAPGPSRPRFFLVASDPQFGMYAKDSNFVQETANFELVIATANRLRPAFVVITGDLINKPGDSAQTAEFWRIAHKLDPAIPLFNVAGNHDVGNTPTPAALERYRAAFGPDHYTFRVGDVIGIVLNSSVIDSSRDTPGALAEQERWLEHELATARASGARHLLVFQHHPWFLADASEPDQYFNIPLAHRNRYLALFHRYGVEALFSGHYHQNAVARDREIAMITTGPVGMPFGGVQSGVRLVAVSDSGLSHHYYGLGELPHTVTLPFPQP